MIQGLLVLGIVVFRYAGFWSSKGSWVFLVTDGLHLLLLLGLAWLGGKISGNGRLFPRPLGGLMLFLLLYGLLIVWITWGGKHTGQGFSFVILHPLAVNKLFNRSGWTLSAVRLILGIWYWTWACAAVQAWILEPRRRR